MLWQHRPLSRLGFPEVVVYAKYGTTGNFLYLGQLGIRTVIPTTRFGNMRGDIWGVTTSSGCQVRTLTSALLARS